MKRHRVTVELELDLPEKMTAEKVIPKLKIVSTSVTIGKFKVLSDEPLPETLLPFEQFDNDKIAIRRAILEVLAKNGYDFMCVSIAADTQWSGQRLTHLAMRPMKLDVWVKANHPLSGHRLEYKIRDGNITDYTGKKIISPLADPDFKGLVAAVKTLLTPKKGVILKENWLMNYGEDDDDE